MKKLLFLIPLLLFLLASCDSRIQVTHPDSEYGKIPIKLNLAPALEQDYRITRVIVTIRKDDYSESLDLQINGELATGTFYGLEPGIYNITVQMFEDSAIIASGNGTATVVAGETATAYITMEFLPTTGDLEIIVTWGTLPERILFIGNSYTYSNGGLDSILEQIVWSNDPFAWIEIDEITGGGMTLQNHFNTATTINTIEEGRYDVVILQEQSQMPYLDPPTFYEFATRLDSVITSSGADTWFLMTWAREDQPQQIVDLQFAYESIADSLDAHVIPVGIAFDNVAMNPNTPLALNLYNTDGSHPSQEGSYLAGCCLFARLFRQSPVGIEWTFATMTEEYQLFLQETAWSVCEEYEH
ncbi:MAG: hypothetical protein JXR56_00425 [Candidatus Cloacimonetes bacterium]|nr:hypothetical protein [Candidatus Cloacimonadota bacterium]